MACAGRPREVEAMIEKVLEGRGKIIAEIRASAEPQFLLGDFPVVMGDEDATLNIIFGDAGVGKSLLNQCLIHSLLEYSDEYVVLWFDLEYQSSIAKQRGVDYLLERFRNWSGKPLLFKGEMKATI